MNSKSEFDRCKVPRLVIEEEDKEQEKLQEMELQKVMETLDAEERKWGAAKYKERSNELRNKRVELGPLEPATATKREQEQPKGRRAKKLKYAKIGADWGRAA